MCGLAGEFCFQDRADLRRVESMSQTLRHRGPDEGGSWLSPDGRCALALRRLNVIDPELSHQPMTTPEGQRALAFNGELYNFRQLRDELPQTPAGYRTRGDTEVLLQSLATHGTRGLDRLAGMFALAYYDAEAGRLLLARDRLGQKPLWYSLLPDRIVFASEPKALLKHPHVDKTPDKLSLSRYLAVGYIDSPGSAWQGVHKLPPASVLVHTGRSCEISRYWQPAPQTAEPQASAEEWIERVRETLTASVRQRLIADVPLGALLSGGVDSAVVVALMTQQAGRTGGVRTFPAGFDEPAYDERPQADHVARHLGTDHTNLLVTPEPADMLDFVVRQYDEPFADSSAFPTWLICKATRQHVTVALTGDGGDEVFGGYDRYRAMLATQQMGPAQYTAWRLVGRLLRPLAPLDERALLRRIVRFADALHLPPALQYLRYRQLFDPADLPRLLTDDALDALDPDEPAREFADRFSQCDADSEVTRARLHDLASYLPGDVLTKTDIASMACSLELRSPLLDHRVVQVGLDLPETLVTTRRRGKIALQRAFCHLLPPDVFTRRKRGFGVPLGRWLRTDLKQTMLDVLTDPSVRQVGLLRPEALQGLVNDHLSGRADHSHRLWALMVLCRWLQRQ